MRHRLLASKYSETIKSCCAADIRPCGSVLDERACERIIYRAPPKSRSLSMSQWDHFGALILIGVPPSPEDTGTRGAGQLWRLGGAESHRIAYVKKTRTSARATERPTRLHPRNEPAHN